MRLFFLPIVFIIGLAVYFLAASLLPVTIVVTWDTATEVNTAGFNVYRADQRDGPFVKLNDKLLPASSDALRGGSYRYEDSGVRKGQTYFYLVEDVEYAGSSTRHGPLEIRAPSPFDLNPVTALLIALGLALGVIVFRGRQHAAESS